MDVYCCVFIPVGSGLYRNCSDFAGEEYFVQQSAGWTLDQEQHIDTKEEG